MKRLVIEIAAVLVAAAVIVSLCNRLAEISQDRDRYRNNTESLLSDVERWQVRDSLSAVRVQSLELSLKDYERYRAEDARLIDELKRNSNRLAAVNKTQMETIIQLQGRPRDTVVIVRDSIVQPAVAVRCGDKWYDFEGIVTPENFSGTLQVRDSLVIAETVKYGRFLWWRTKKVKERNVQAVSLNPYTEIMGIEHIFLRD